MPMPLHSKRGQYNATCKPKLIQIGFNNKKEQEAFEDQAYQQDWNGDVNNWGAVTQVRKSFPDKLRKPFTYYTFDEMINDQWSTYYQKTVLVLEDFKNPTEVVKQGFTDSE